MNTLVYELAIRFLCRFSSAGRKIKSNFAGIVHDEVSWKGLARFRNELRQEVSSILVQKFYGLRSVNGLLKDNLVDLKFARSLVRL